MTDGMSTWQALAVVLGIWAVAASVLALLAGKWLWRVPPQPRADPVADAWHGHAAAHMVDADDWLVVHRTQAEMLALRKEAETELRDWVPQGRLPVLTCNTCNDAHRCPYAFDTYNTDGDCLGGK